MQKFQTKRIRTAIVLLSTLMLTACTLNAATNKKTNQNASLTDGSVNTIHSTEVEPVTSIPEKSIYLYPMEDPMDEGAILKIGEKQQKLDWIYSTPRQIMPVLQLHDYDRDGEDELAVVLHAGSGSGVAIEELHLVEFVGTTGTTEQPFIDHEFDPDDYLDQIGNAVSFSKVSKNGEWYGRITIDGQTHEVSLKDFLQEYEIEKIQDKLGFGNIVYFKVEKGQLTMKVAIGLVIDGIAEPQYFGDIEAVVSYKAGSFKLGQFCFTSD